MKLIDGEAATIPVPASIAEKPIVLKRRGRAGAHIDSTPQAGLLEVVVEQLSTLDAWANHGRKLGQAERALGWAVGAWWNAGERFGERVAIVQAADWNGPSHKTCRNYGSVVNQIPASRRQDTLSFAHHAEVAGLPEDEADEILAQAARQALSTGNPPPVNQIRQIVKARRRRQREEVLGAATTAVSKVIGRKLYGVIYADPPWRFEPRSRETGMDRAADNHYPTMDKAQLEAIRLPASSNCALFLWATAPMLEHALDLMRHWGFEYRSHLIWQKDRLGTGYWARNMHELLLIGIKGKMPAPAMGSQPSSVIASVVRRHSEKPERFAKLIEVMFPSQAKLEMFARKQRDGWDVFGNEVSNETA